MAEKKQKRDISPKENRKKVLDSSVEDVTAEVLEEIDKRDEEIKSLKEELEKTTNLLKNALSDYQNLKKRTEVEKENVVGITNNLLLRQFLEVADDIYAYILHLEQSEKNGNLKVNISEIKSGTKLILDKCNDIVKGQGAQVMVVNEGDTFSPLNHEVIGTVNVDDPEKENKVIQVVRVGYEQNGKVVRPARIIVGKKES
ncbi:MAG: nucleotide exchange factor GrpE [Patescibacteria group bacterium]